ncbi:hypothetical protein LCGC14_1818620, partial [marine sediment metagenome]
MPTLQEIRDDRIKRESAITPPKPPSLTETVNRSEKIFDISAQKNISTEEAESEVLVSELMGFVKILNDSPLHQDMDGLIDIFDPSEPPQGGEGIADPRGDLIKAELAAIREPVKWALKASSYIFAPLDRAFKFLTNATMYDPLTKSVAGPIRRQILIDLENTEVLKRVKPEREKLRVELLEKHKGKRQAFSKEFRERFDEIEERTRQEVRKDMAGIVQVETEAIEKLPKVGIKDVSQSAVDALKTLVPWPGFADDVKSGGEIAADSFGRIVGRDAPWYYAPVTDVAEQTIALGGLLRVAASTQAAEEAGLIAKGVKFTRSEIRAIKRLHKAASIVRK